MEDLKLYFKNKKRPWVFKYGQFIITFLDGYYEYKEFGYIRKAKDKTYRALFVTPAALKVEEFINSKWEGVMEGIGKIDKAVIGYEEYKIGDIN